jgi:serine/threonine-protein phosphatase PGAM5
VTARWLYLARHGDAPDGSLSVAGRRQASLLSARLAAIPFATITHSPETRAVQTAAALPGAQPSPLAGDYLPHVPEPVPPAFTAFFDSFSAEESREGPELAREALARFAVPADQETHELVITHSFLIAWFVRDALGAPPERWLGLNAANAALTVIRYSEERGPALLQFNDMSHLPPELHWTGFPAHLRAPA